MIDTHNMNNFYCQNDDMVENNLNKILHKRMLTELKSQFHLEFLNILELDFIEIN